MQTSKEKYSSKKFITVFSIVFFVALMCIGLISYIVDPFFQFRAKPDTRYFLNPRFVTGGLAKSYDYNVVVLGSSMTQNFNMNILRNISADYKPVKLSTGGMNCVEMEYIYSLIKKEQVKTFIINIDIPQFNSTFEEVRYPQYLYEDGIVNKLKYLYGYETFVRFTPIDIGLTLYLKDESKITPEYDMKTNIDNVGNTSLDVHYGADYVKQLYLSGWTVSEQLLEDMKSRMQTRLDSMLARMSPDKYPNAEYVFVMPPYSALYWYHAKKQGYYNEFMDFTRYIEYSIRKYNNVRIALFFDMDEITDLNFYADITHFNPAISDKILENIKNPAYELTPSNIDCKLHRVDSLVNVFVEQNKDWLK
ncbi:MAG: hypothetical protein ACK5M3_05165 [Dysgonomonas sp.]